MTKPQTQIEDTQLPVDSDGEDEQMDSAMKPLMILLIPFILLMIYGAVG